MVVFNYFKEFIIRYHFRRDISILNYEHKIIIENIVFDSPGLKTNTFLRSIPDKFKVFLISF